MSGPTTVSAEDGNGAGFLRRRNLAAFTWLLAVAALAQLALQANGSGVLQISPRWQATLVAGAVVLAVTGVALLFLRRIPTPGVVVGAGRRIDGAVGRRGLSLGWMAIIAAIFPLAVFGPTGRYLEGIFPRLLLFWLVILLLSILLRSWFPETRWEHLLLAAAVGYALFLRALAFVPEVSAYPFSLGWSEASRYYYASLFDAESIYGVQVHPSELHPTRYLLQSLPYFVANFPLWFHRLWQVVLWWLLPVATAALLVARHRLAGPWIRLLVGGWIVLYLFQGPAYYHLLVAVVIILAGFDVERPWRSTLFVVAASVWAGLSRVNWFPVPALLAGCLYVLEGPPGGRYWRVLRWPLAWAVLGTLVALASQGAYVRFTGIQVDRFASSFSSELLFYRLLPNATYSLGILPATLLASAPLLLSLWWSRSTWQGRLDQASQGFLVVAILALGAGGLLVSLKIGGGSNLHNLDAYLVLLLLVGSSLLLRDSPSNLVQGFEASLPPLRQTALLVAIPVVFAVAAAGRWLPHDFAAAETSLRRIRDKVEEVGGEGKRVLFISQRHLLTFGMIEGIPLEPEYETVFLMEMAMSGNRAYLDRFHELLQEQAFGLIVTDRLGTTLQGRSHNFGEENDAWVKEVSIPILCSYQWIDRLEQPPVDLLVPREEGSACPG